MRRTVSRRSAGDTILTAVSLYLLITAGMPYTILMAVVVAAWTIAAAVFRRRLTNALWMVAANVIGVMLAAPALLMLLEYMPSTVRSVGGNIGQAHWNVPLGGFFGLVFPTFTSTWNEFSGPSAHAAVEMAGGLVPLIGVVAAVWLLRRDYWRRHWPDLVLVVAIGVLAVVPSVGVFRWSFRWLAMFHLAFAVAGARAIAAIWAARAASAGSALRWNLGAWGLGIAVVVAAVILGVYSAEAVSLPYVALTLLLLALWMAADANASPAFRRLFPAVVAFFSVFSIYSFVPADQSVPVWRLTDRMRNPEPFRRDLLYMADLCWPDLMRGSRRLQETKTDDQLFRPGNTPMLAKLRFANGYSPMNPAGMHTVLGLQDHGYVQLPDAVRLLMRETQPRGVLEHLSIDGLIVSAALLRQLDIRSIPGWKTLGRTGEYSLFRRAEPIAAAVQIVPSGRWFGSEPVAAQWIRRRSEDAMPWVLSFPTLRREGDEHFCSAVAARNVIVERLRTSVDVDASACTSDSMIEFMRPRFPGYVATSGDERLQVVKGDLIVPVVRVKPGTRGRVVLSYEPRSLWVGAVAAGFAAAALAAIAAFSMLKSRDHVTTG